MTTQWKSVRLLLKNKDNRQWWIKNWGYGFVKSFTAFVSVWGILGAFNISFTDIMERFLPGSSVAVLIAGSLLCLIGAGLRSIDELNGYSQLRVETERAGCSVEIRLADSYLTNAFENYPNSAMIIGINKAFWFQEAEPKSLIADMWKKLEQRGINKEEVQIAIDQALKGLWTNERGEVDEALKASYIDQSRPKVYVQCSGVRKDRQPCRKDCTYDCMLKKTAAEDGVFTECRDNYKVGTVVGVDLCWEEPEKQERNNMRTLIPEAMGSAFSRIRYNCISFADRILWVKPKEKGEKPLGFVGYIRRNLYKTVPSKTVSKKLYLMANAEVVQGHDMKEPMKVTFDRNASVVESFPQIWKYFEMEEEKTPMPPKHLIYQPLLIPLIGAGVANEGYTDMEIFSKIVDLYYENLRKSIRAGKHPAIANLIINIQNKTAIELSGSEDATSRKIDIKTAFWYLKYRNQVNPVSSRED